MFLVPLAVGVVFLAACWGFCRMTRDPERPSLARLADPRPLPSESYGPFPADTVPLLLMSDAMASADAIGREVDEMIQRAEWLSRPRRLR